MRSLHFVVYYYFRLQWW